MTEEEWLKGADLRKILMANCRMKTATPSERRLRLFVTAFWRWQAGNLRTASGKSLLQAVELAELWAETGTRPPEAKQFRQVVVSRSAKSAAYSTTAAMHSWGEAGTRATRQVASYFRCVFPNPFRIAVVNPDWCTSTVRSLAHAAYEERILPTGHLEPHRLAVLADALEDSGCTDAEILEHLRGPGPHVRGCWAVDLLLGKS